MQPKVEILFFKVPSGHGKQVKPDLESHGI